MLFYNAVDIKFVVIISLLEWPFCLRRGVQGKHFTLMDLQVHDEQVAPSSIFLVVSINTCNVLLCTFAAEIKFNAIVTIYQYHKRLKLWLSTQEKL